MILVHNICIKFICYITFNVEFIQEKKHSEIFGKICTHENLAFFFFLYLQEYFCRRKCTQKKGYFLPGFFFKFQDFVKVSACNNKIEKKYSINKTPFIKIID